MIRGRCCCIVLALGVACVRAHPPSPEALRSNQLCAHELSEDRLDAAESACNNALHLSPQFSEAWTNRGFVFLRRGLGTDARSSFAQAVKYNGGNARAYNGLGIVALLNREYTDAEGQFKRALQLQPDYDAARFNLALDYFGDRAIARAKRTMELQLERRPKSPDAYLFLAAFRLAEKGANDAVSFSLKAIRLDPHPTAYWLCLADAYNFQHRYDDAEYALKSCLEIDSRDDNCHENLQRLKARDELIPPQLGPPRP